MNLPAVMLNVVTVRLARISPSATVMALPIMGTKAKNAISAPRPAMKRCALSIFSSLMWRYFSIQSMRPKVPIQ